MCFLYYICLQNMRAAVDRVVWLGTDRADWKVVSIHRVMRKTGNAEKEMQGTVSVCLFWGTQCMATELILFWFSIACSWPRGAGRSTDLCVWSSRALTKTSKNIELTHEKHTSNRKGDAWLTRPVSSRIHTDASHSLRSHYAQRREKSPIRNWTGQRILGLNHIGTKMWGH